MSRKTQKNPVTTSELAPHQHLYQGSFLINPSKLPDQQDYLVVDESWKHSRYKRIRSELEMPIFQALNELSKSGRYASLQIETVGMDESQKVNRVVLTVRMNAERPKSDALVADMIGLLVQLMTFAVVGAVDRCPSVVRKDYQLELALGRLTGDHFQIVRNVNAQSEGRGYQTREAVLGRRKSVAPGKQPLYDEAPATEKLAAKVAIVSEGSPAESSPGKDWDHKRTDQIIALFKGLPDDPKSRLTAVVALQKAFRREAAKVLQTSVQKLLSEPPVSFVEKQSLATDLNSAFHQLGLAVSSSEISDPCSVIPYKSQSVTSGWLRIQTRKSPRQWSGPSTKLDQIELIEAVREEAFGRKK